MEQLATRCPHCQTTFRVTQEQLRLRAGKVRCGVCRESFDGVAQQIDHHGETLALPRTETVTGSPASALDFNLVPVSLASDPTDRMTAINFGLAENASGRPTGSSMQAELDALSQAIAGLQAKPWSEPLSTAQIESATIEPALEERDVDFDSHGAEPVLAFDGDIRVPPFIQSARRRSRGRRVWKVLLWIFVPLLTLALAAQLVYYFRNDIAARSSQAAQQLRALCIQLGCAIRLPMHLDKLSLDATQLDASPLPTHVAEPDSQADATADKPLAQRLTLVALLRNRGDTAQAWPSIDLQLKTADGKVIVRKSFLPAQYLRADDIEAGLLAHSETEIRISFELAGDAPAGFEAALFYH